MTSFSVLQSVYKKDNPKYLDEAFQSIADNTIVPSQVVIVKDGLLTPDLETIIEHWQNKLPLKVVGYEENHGLCYALDYGLKYCDNEIIFRMDSDDLCYKNRFQKQLEFLEENPDVALFSGYISEFDIDRNIPKSIRRVPITYDNIVTFLKKRSAFNHVAVCFKKSAIIDSGSYQMVPWFEDYDLWIRVVQKGYKVANIPELLVDVRVGNDMIGRRHGITYAKQELFFLKRQLKNGFINKKDYIKLIFLRVFIRLMPKWVLSIVYKLLRG